MKNVLKCKIWIIVLLTLLYQTTPAQEKNKLKTIERLTIIPFQLTTANNLVIKAILNQKDTVNLMFHTADNSLTLTEEATKKIKSLNFDGIDTVKSWGGVKILQDLVKTIHCKSEHLNGITFLFGRIKILGQKLTVNLA